MWRCEGTNLSATDLHSFLVFVCVREHLSPPPPPIQKQLPLSSPEVKSRHGTLPEVCVHLHLCAWRCVYFRISCKDLKSMLCQVNYRVPNMKFLREKLPVTSSHSSHFPNTPPHQCVCFQCLPNPVATLPPLLSLFLSGLGVEEWRRVL